MIGERHDPSTYRFWWVYLDGDSIDGKLCVGLFGLFEGGWVLGFHSMEDTCPHCLGYVRLEATPFGVGSEFIKLDYVIREFASQHIEVIRIGAVTVGV